MATPEQPRFTIVGAGLAGALLACYLGRAGYRVDVYEKRSDPRCQDPNGGRSINLAISARGLQALREVGLADEVLEAAIPMRGRMMHSRTGALSFQPYGKDETESIYSVSRADLNRTLVNAAARCASVQMFFEKKCVGVDLRSAHLTILDEVSHTTSELAGETVIGCDGVYSVVRAHMQKEDRFNYQQDYLTHGYKELTMPAGPQGSFAMEKHALHIWPRRSFMLIALPNLDGSFTCTLFCPFEGPNSFASLQTEGEVRRFFGEQFPDALALLPGLAADFFKNPTGSLLTVRCSPWHVDGKVVLLGDACHAVVPFLGQGMNAAFEDCTVLNRCLTEQAPNWKAAFATYELRRKVHVDTLAGLCLDNFIEMRDRVGSQTFLLKKRWEVFLHKLFPMWYLPLYTLVTFTCTPYAEALRRVRKQNRIVRSVVVLLAGGVIGLITWWCW
ncbi:MAG TPA: NAD(P)/FAD-dependent oxidoreductase [Gemmataceae bacterium]|nr:NAD(P)/FAD-dependent oxidoreductase [Gemmataceae bacterium]